MKQIICDAEVGFFGQKAAEHLKSIACGCLIARGAIVGALSAGWSMAALLSPDAGVLLGAALFAAGSAVPAEIRRSFGERANRAADRLECAVIGMWMGCSVSFGVSVSHLLSFAAVLAAMCIVRRWRLTFLVGMVLTAAMTVSLASAAGIHSLLMLRLEAVGGTLAGACMCAEAAVCMSEREERTAAVWLTAGMAFGLAV